MLPQEDDTAVLAGGEAYDTHLRYGSSAMDELAVSLLQQFPAVRLTKLVNTTYICMSHYWLYRDTLQYQQRVDQFESYGR